MIDAVQVHENCVRFFIDILRHGIFFIQCVLNLLNFHLNVVIYNYFIKSIMPIYSEHWEDNGKIFILDF